MHTVASFEAHVKEQGYPSLTEVVREAAYALGEHSHPFDACALILAGSITLQVNGIATCYREGEVFELPRNTPHHEWAGEQGVRYLAGRRV
jgi:quercetin dioxygenase-like cupin family protein